MNQVKELELTLTMDTGKYFFVAVVPGIVVGSTGCQDAKSKKISEVKQEMRALLDSTNHYMDIALVTVEKGDTTKRLKI